MVFTGDVTADGRAILSAQIQSNPAKIIGVCFTVQMTQDVCQLLKI